MACRRSGWLGLVVLVLALPAMGVGGSAPDATADLSSIPWVTCDRLPGGDAADPGGVLGQLPQVMPSCPAAIRPGANSNSCTLNFVVTDGIDLFIGAAGHCTYPGKRLTVAGVPGQVGTVVHHRSEIVAGTGSRDWAFIKIDPEDRIYVNPTMCRWGGPSATALGSARAPEPGEVVLHYGWGVSYGLFENTRGRAGVTIITDPTNPVFAFVGAVAGGDSGSPVRLASGEAAGIAVATALPGYVPNYVLATRFDAALADFSAALGRPVTVVTGDPLPSLPAV